MLDISHYPMSSRSEDFYFSYQYHHLGFSEFISLLTLCLAPLMAHIFVGAPQPVILHHPEPSWGQKILHFNPTSIYWRYYAITLRRARASRWTGIEAACTNAIFWDGKKWDGTKDMMSISEKFGVEVPDRGRIPLDSISAVKTVVVTIQGAQAAYDLANGINLGAYALTVSLANIYRPLAIAGLFRLPASLWLTDEYRYATPKSKVREVLEAYGLLRLQGDLESTTMSEIPPQPSPSQEASLRPTPELSTQTPGSERAHSSSIPPPQLESIPTKNKWLPRVVKIIFLLPVLALLGLVCYYFRPNPRITSGTASTLAMNLFYAVLLLATFTTTLFYTFIQDRTDQILIPCINSFWYRIYTYTLFVFAFVLLVIAALETRRTSCGQFTTYPEWLNLDHWLCPP